MRRLRAGRECWTRIEGAGVVSDVASCDSTGEDLGKAKDKAEDMAGDMKEKVKKANDILMEMVSDCEDYSFWYPQLVDSPPQPNSFEDRLCFEGDVLGVVVYLFDHDFD